MSGVRFREAPVDKLMDSLWRTHTSERIDLHDAVHADQGILLVSSTGPLEHKHFEM